MSTLVRPAARRRVGLEAISSLLIVVSLLVVWQVATSLSQSSFFPTPLAILERLVEYVSGVDSRAFLLGQVGATLSRILMGFALGSIAGVAIGIWLGMSRRMTEYTNPAVDFFRSVPATAAIPLFIILLGGGDLMRVAFIAWSISWFVLINTANGVASVEPTLLSMSRVFLISSPRRTFRIIIPGAAPEIFAGLRVALTAAVLFSVVSEFYLAVNGIGFQIIQAQRRFFIVDMWMWMVVLALIAWGLNVILEIIQKRVLRWHRESRR